ncbi:MAG: alpha/beta hydrolase-fold protein [Gammaproteobacteria bacterium]|nr:alpha/beta hydrolase-fold protein [Gammaproteobacteria bacterium]
MAEENDKIEINPSGPSRGSVIWLHGLGASGDDFVPVARELNTLGFNLRFIFPHAPMQPVTINGGYVMRAWYDIVSLSIDSHADTSGMEKTEQTIHALIQAEEKNGTPTEKIILAGFSQGAVMALLTGLRYPKKLAGILALSGYLPHPNETIANAPKKNHATPIFIGHGTADTIVPCILGKTVFDALQHAQYSVEWHDYLMPHSVCMEEVADIAQWMGKIYSEE